MKGLVYIISFLVLTGGSQLYGQAGHHVARHINTDTTFNVPSKLFFQFLKWDLMDNGKGLLDSLVLVLIEDTTKQITIECHLALSTPTHLHPSWFLSQRRADEVLKYLKENGIKSKRISSYGREKDCPIYSKEILERLSDDNEKAEADAANERVTFTIIKK